MSPRLLVVVLCCLVLPACGWLQDASRALLGKEEDAREQQLENFTPRLKVKEIWSRSVGADATDSSAKLIPLVQGNVVFAGGAQGEVRAFSAHSGKRMWKRSFKTDLSFAVGGGGDILMVGTAHGEIIALAASSGKPVWRRRVSGDEITAISSHHRGLILVRDSGGRIAAIKVEDGEKLWQFDTELPSLTLRGMSIPLLYDDLGIIGLDDGRVLLVSSNSGRILYELKLGLTAEGSDLERLVDIDGQMEIYEGILYVATYRGRTLALDVETQKILWIVDAESYAGVDVDDEFVYLVDTGGRVRSLDRFNGSEAWYNPIFSVRDLSTPLVSGETIVVGDNLGYLYWLSRRDGAILARERIARAPITGALAQWKNHTLAFDRGGDLTAVKIVSRLVPRNK